MDADAIDPESLFINGSTCKDSSTRIYQPVQHHWFHVAITDNTKEIWYPFSSRDSRALDEKYHADGPDDEKIVATDGGRYDVNIGKRQKFPVYWSGESTEVRRCSWFHKSSTTSKYQPYDEEIAAKLEEEYKNCFEKNEWHKRILLPNQDTIVFHSYDILVLFPPSFSPDEWNNGSAHVRPRIVRRGVEGFDIDDGEPDEIDHVLFMVHGIGSVCDLKFRTVQEVVDDFRNISLQLLRAHYQSSCEKKLANRLEVLPISWHDQLHSEDTGIDKRLQSITLESIPRLRDFTNNTLLDILFYTSPKYCQKIVSTVGSELNRLYELFKKRNPSFRGKVFLGGHSLGSLILFDILSHSQPGDEDDLNCTSQNTKPDRRISHMYSAVDSGRGRIHYPQLMFQPKAFFALGSPIGMFLTVRGLDSLGEEFALPNCESFFNIFHPYDPVAYRIESLINPTLASLKPMLIPHHKGRKRMHLELKETLSRVGADLKQRVVDSVKQTWNSFFQLGIVHPEANHLVEQDHTTEAEIRSIEETETVQNSEILGILNKGRRVDYVLQESPFEIFNEYVFSLSSHVCYWDSEDTMLFILKEIYSTLNIQPDSQIPQATMTIERPVEPGSRRGSGAIFSALTSNSVSSDDVKS